ncbi:hypothetical protein PGT21_025004 [Puccinia graminis f. sp. tritici]|uniref:Uncharacterized protein n=1 Tax=Puccinia graminis f. sp. tritici TaxID=56615 RepID=A0A5B0QBA8_PUCGR|nr:hypothetical protein PGT21_025004 [Puccinia graminis f. sp. tritici]
MPGTGQLVAFKKLDQSSTLYQDRPASRFTDIFIQPAPPPPPVAVGLSVLSYLGITTHSNLFPQLSRPSLPVTLIPELFSDSVKTCA